MTPERLEDGLIHEVRRLSDLVAEFRKREETQDRIRERLTAERDHLRAAVDDVLTLHQPEESNFVRLPPGTNRGEAERIYRDTPQPTAIYCSTCMNGMRRVSWPCATARALAPAAAEPTDTKETT